MLLVDGGFKVVNGRHNLNFAKLKWPVNNLVARVVYYSKRKL